MILFTGISLRCSPFNKHLFFICVAFFLGLFFACQTDNQSLLLSDKNSYEYEEGLNDYLKFSGLEGWRDSYDQLFLIPLQSCTPCLETTMSYILLNHQSSSQKIKVILVGKAETPANRELAEKLRLMLGDDAYLDTSTTIYEYETNVRGISLLHRLENNLIEIQLTDQIWSQLAPELGWSF